MSVWVFGSGRFSPGRIRCSLGSDSAGASDVETRSC